MQNSKELWLIIAHSGAHWIVKAFYRLLDVHVLLGVNANAIQSI